MKKSIFEYDHYREFLSEWLSSRADENRGAQGRLASAMGISSTMMSLILKGDKQLNAEQAIEACEHMALNERETDYFLLLVEYGRSGSHKLSSKLKKRINEMREEQKNLSKRLKKDRQLSEEEVSIFYSHWLYSAASLACALPEVNDVQAIAKRFNISTVLAAQIIEFLLSAGLSEKQKGKLHYGNVYTHLESNSPNVIKHHQNWRIKSMNDMDTVNDKNLFYTGPFALSKAAAEKIRTLLPQFIEEVVQIAGPSDSETMYCFNLDWFEF